MFAKPLAELGLTNLPAPFWGIDTVISGPRLYKPETGGTLALILPVIEQERIVDLVSCTFTSCRVRTRRGATAVLGPEWIDRARANGEPLKVFDDVFAWLRGRCRGVVILDWDAAGRLLRDVPTLHCESHAMVQVLTETFGWPQPDPPITDYRGARR